MGIPTRNPNVYILTQKGYAYKTSKQPIFN